MKAGHFCLSSAVTHAFLQSVSMASVSPTDHTEEQH